MDWFLLAFVSAVFSAAAAVSEKKSLMKLDPLQFSFLVSAVTLLFSAPFFIDLKFPGSPAESILILFVKSMMSGAAFFFVMVSIKKLDISEALPMLALSPGVIAVAGFFFINDNLILAEWGAILLMVIGTYLLELRKENSSVLSPFFALFSSKKYLPIFTALILFTISSLVDRVLLRDFKLPPFTFMAFQQLFYALLFTAALLIRNKGFKSSFVNVDKSIIYLLAAVSIFTVIYRYTQIEAVKLAPAALVISVKRLSVLMAIIAGGRMFNEQNLTRRIIAAIIILAGTLILGLSA